LGWAFHYGIGVTQSYKKSFEWYKRAAMQGYACAEYNLGNAYSEGCGVKKNPRLAVKWWQKAAKQNDAFAQNNLGNAYEDATGVRKNISKARAFFAASAKQGDVIAQFNLARFKLATGPRSVAQMKFKAIIPKLKKQAQANDYNALLCLSDCAFFGWGMALDKKKAARWSRMAEVRRDKPVRGHGLN